MGKNIKRIDEKDSISKSMDIINENFQILSKVDENEKQKWEKYINYFDKRASYIIDTIDSKNIEISEQLENISNNIPDMDALKHQVSEAISDVNSELGNAIKNISVEVAGKQVTEAMGDYAKTTYVNNKLNNVNDKLGNYITSVAFEDYKSNAKEHTASANLIVANSKFYTNPDGYFVWIDGSPSEYKNLKDYYNNINIDDKSSIDPTGNGLSDPDVLNRFISYCEQKFKTISTELAGFSANVGDGSAKMDILTQIQGEDGEDIVAAIFTEANKSGSSIKLNADHLNLVGDDLVINTNNLKVNADGQGTVVVKGAIAATSLTIISSAASDFNNLVQSVVSSAGYINDSYLTSVLGEYAKKGETTSGEPYNDGWLTNAFKKTDISGGLVLTGNILAVDNSNNVTAGMMGATTSGSDLRFFAGSTDLSRAPFRVYEDGSFYATNAHITGEIEATSLTIGYSAASDFNNLVQSAVSNAGYVNDSYLTSVLGTYVNTTTFNNTLSKYAKKGETTSGEPYNDEWLTNAFKKTDISGGLVLTGNILAVDNSNNVTAGMMGATTSGSDLRFFAGSADLSKAPFRVYEDGSFYATNAHITGDIEATSLTIGYSAASDFNNLVQGAVSNAGYVNDSYLTSVLGTYVNTTTFNNTLSKYAKKGEDEYNDEWLTNAFNKVSIVGGIALAGNIFAADSDGNITAGMMGANTIVSDSDSDSDTNVNDLRFFAGSDSTNTSNAPFRVYEDGSFYATKANITGLITNKFLKITSSNWEKYKFKLGEKDGIPYYSIDLNKTGTNVEIAYLPPLPTSIQNLVYQIYTPSITESMVGAELNIINTTGKLISVGYWFNDPYIEGRPPTNAAIIYADSSNASGYTTGSAPCWVQFLECMRLKAIEVPDYDPEVGGTRYAWIRLDKYITPES